MALVRVADVSGGQDTGLEQAIRTAYEAKARAELAAADALLPGVVTVTWSGAVLADIALVKGLKGPGEASGGAALSGPDGAAASKALVALGWPEHSVFRTVSRPESDCDERAVADRLRRQIEAVDPAVVVALDAEAATDLARAMGVEGLGSGVSRMAAGRRLVAVDGLEASLGDESLKRRVWKQLQAAAPDGPVF